MDDYSRRLADREQVFVFKKDVEGGVSGLHRGARACGGRGDLDGDDVAGRQSGRHAANVKAVDGNGTLLDPGLHACPGGRIEVCQVPAKYEIEPSSRIAAISGERADGHALAVMVSATLLKPPSLCAQMGLSTADRFGDGFAGGAGGRTLPGSALFLKREVQSFRKSTECECRAPQRDILLSEPGEFLATV